MTPNRGIDADFLSLPRHELADAALSAATAAGASHADLRIHRLVNEIILLGDGELETAVLNREIGLAVRVIVDGTWGFASHAELSPEVAADTARRAVSVATTLAALNTDRVELAPEPVYTDASWVSNYRIDPFTVPTAEKIAVLDDYSGRLLAADGVDHVQPARRQRAHLLRRHVRIVGHSAADPADARPGSGHRGRQLRVRLDAHRGAAMARGWEVLAGDEVWNWTDELAQLPSQLAEKIKAPGVTPGPTDLVIDPTNLWLTIHESIGHATEYDRAIGYEAAYAGTSCYPRQARQARRSSVACR